MPRPSRLATPRGLRAAALLAAPVLLGLAVPASAAATVQVTPAPEECGLVVALTGLADGAHTAVVTVEALGTGEPVPVVPAADPTAPPSSEPVLSAERTVTGDGELVVVLDAAAVPDADPRVLVEVTLDGQATPAAELALPGCGVPPTPPPATPTSAPTTEPTSETTTEPTTGPTTEPTTGPTTEPTSEPTSDPTAPPAPPLEQPTTEPTTEPGASEAPALPSAPASTTVSPSTDAAPLGTSTPTTSPRPTASPTPPTTTATLAAAASPVLTGAPVPIPAPTSSGTLEATYGAFDLGTGSSGSLSLVSFTAAPQLDAVLAPASVPAPVIAAPEGSAAGVLAAAQATGTPLEDLLPQPPQADADPAPAQLAAPDLATDAAADPLVELAPAAFVLSASLGGLLMAGRRRTS